MNLQAPRYRAEYCLPMSEVLGQATERRGVASVIRGRIRDVISDVTPNTIACQVFLAAVPGLLCLQLCRLTWEKREDRRGWTGKIGREDGERGSGKKEKGDGIAK